jgi:hypothetical protein
MSVIALRYIGAGAYRPSLPARDLDADDIAFNAAFGKRSVAEFVAEALGCGLYRAIYDVEPEPEPIAEGSRWEDLTKAQLLAYAAEHGIEIVPRATNAAIREAIVAFAEAAVDAAPEPESPAEPEVPSP